MKNRLKIIAVAFIAGSSVLQAQQQDSVANDLQRPFQISFFTPLGTNGMDSWKYTNNFSFNIIAGYAGGLKGFELGGFSNLILHDVYGSQIAGFCNTTIGKTEGIQISGFSNVSKKFLKGAQIAGFSNVVADSAMALQISGFSNVVNGSLKGAQISGFANVAKGSTDGAQIAGFSNYSHSDSRDIQIAGFSNVTKGDLIGSQISGFSNVTSGDIAGVQVSGFINVAKKVKGTQISFINICDTIEDGIAIGFLSIVKKGYRAFEIGADETMYAQANFKIGTERFYNIFSLGAQQKSGNFNWGFGYGVGSLIDVSDKLALNADAVCYQVNYDNIFYDRVNILTNIRVSVAYKLNSRISIYGGPTYNVYVSNMRNSEGSFITDAIAPWTTYSKARVNALVQMYPGFTAGIRFN